MKLGLWGARMDNSGLGIQTWEFYKNMNPTKTLVVDISVLERTEERVMRQYPERYPKNATFIHGIPNEHDIIQFLEGLDVVFIAESAYNMAFYQIAREMGVKTAVQYNWEFFDWTDGSMWAHNPPDLFIAPSTWHYDEVSAVCEKRGVKHVYLHCPVNRQEIKRRHIDHGNTFIHIAGRPATHDRNGTFTFLEALKMGNESLERQAEEIPEDEDENLTGDIPTLHGIVFTQDRELEKKIKADYPNVRVNYNPAEHASLYKKGSILVLPRKYGGNCLPLNEALAAGMPVIMSKLSPQTDFLPDRWLVDARESDIAFDPRPGIHVPVYEVDPAALMLKMRWFASMSQDDMLEESNRASELADTVSWDVMREKYTEVLSALVAI